MATNNISLSDLLNGIKHFDGEFDDLLQFISDCDLYYELAPNSQKTQVFSVIKSRISPAAREKISVNSFENWATLKEELKNKIKKFGLSYDGMMAEMGLIRQNDNESIMDYGQRAKDILKKLHAASAAMCPDAAAALRTVNEKYAINKFEQNLLDKTLRIMVNAAPKGSLEESIIMAMEKEVWLGGTNAMTCNYCKESDHAETDCTRKNYRAVKCYNCGRFGHTASVCRSKTNNFHDEDTFNNENERYFRNSNPNNSNENSNFENNGNHSNSYYFRSNGNDHANNYRNYSNTGVDDVVIESNYENNHNYHNTSLAIQREEQQWQNTDAQTQYAQIWQPTGEFDSTQIPEPTLGAARAQIIPSGNHLN